MSYLHDYQHFSKNGNYQRTRIMLAIDEALSVIVRLIERSQQAGEPIDRTIIVVGGTAL